MSRCGSRHAENGSVAQGCPLFHGQAVGGTKATGRRTADTDNRLFDAYIPFAKYIHNRAYIYVLFKLLSTFLPQNFLSPSLSPFAFLQNKHHS
jgi:hypothetical protein